MLMGLLVVVLGVVAILMWSDARIDATRRACGRVDEPVADERYGLERGAQET